MKKPETLATLDAQDTGRRQTNTNTQHRNIKRQHGHHQKPGVNPGAREGYAVPASYKTPAMLLIYIVKSDKSIVGDR